jgi:hypothetical protein
VPASALEKLIRISARRTGFSLFHPTISGPPLAGCSTIRGLVRQDFRAGLALIRVAESFTTIAYYQLGLFTAETLSIGDDRSGVVVGIPLGTYRFAASTRRSFDAYA